MITESSRVYHFDAYRLDPAIRELWCGDEEVSLPPKAFGCLAYLIEHRERAVGRDELISEVWGKTELADSALGHAIMTARRALGDIEEDHQFIKTVPGFGYRWIMPVETVSHTAESRRATWVWPGAAALAAALVIAGGYLFWPGPDDADDTLVWHAEDGDIALILPVDVDAETHHGWIRFGAMEMIADRLRGAGQSMVPAETVIALARGDSGLSDAEQLEQMARATGARLVIGAQAQYDNGRWRVSLRSLSPESPQVSFFAEADDVLEATRNAADRLALSLGLAPAPAPNAEPGLALLLQQVEAARLAQQMDLARALIESAEPELRDMAEIRLQEAWLEYHSHHLDAARLLFVSVLDSPASEQDAVLRARALHGLGGTYFQHGDYRATEAVLSEAIELLDQQVPLDILGDVRRSMGLVTLVQGRLDEARRHLAPARHALASIGDAQGLARLDNNRGLLEALDENFPEALHYFESAAERLAALHDVGGELGAQANLIQTRLGLLDPGSARQHGDRLRELLAQTSNPELIALGKLSLTSLYSANGRGEEGGELLVEVLETTETRPEMRRAYVSALGILAAQREQAGDLEGAAEAAAEVIEYLAPGRDISQDSALAGAALTLVRGYIARDELPAAADAAHRLSDWAERGATAAPKVYAALAQAELAAARGRYEAAGEAFEQALSLAAAGQVPARELHVAERYISWLLGVGPEIASIPNRERILVVADRFTRYAGRSFEAALLQLRVYHALGPASAWRTALRQARELAGEREIPPPLRLPPETS